MQRSIELIAVVTFLGLLFSISYNVGYFSKIDIGILSIMSVEDHISSGIAFLPAAMVGVLFATMMGILDGNRNQNSESPKVDEGSALSKKQLLFNFLTESHYIFVSALVLYCFFLPYDDWLLLIVIFLALFPLIFVTAIRNVLLSFSIEMDIKTARLLFFIVALLLITVFFGGIKGRQDLKLDDNKLTETVIIADKELKLKVIRYFSDGFLAVSDKNLQLLYQGRLIQIEKKQKNTNLSLSCLIGMLCLDENNTIKEAKSKEKE